MNDERVKEINFKLENIKREIQNGKCAEELDDMMKEVDNLIILHQQTKLDFNDQQLNSSLNTIYNPLSHSYISPFMNKSEMSNIINNDNNDVEIGTKKKGENYISQNELKQLELIFNNNPPNSVNNNHDNHNHNEPQVEPKLNNNRNNLANNDVSCIISEEFDEFSLGKNIEIEMINKRSEKELKFLEFLSRTLRKFLNDQKIEDANLIMQLIHKIQKNEFPIYNINLSSYTLLPFIEKKNDNNDNDNDIDDKQQSGIKESELISTSSQLIWSEEIKIDDGKEEGKEEDDIIVTICDDHQFFDNKNDDDNDDGGDFADNDRNIHDSDPHFDHKIAYFDDDDEKNEFDQIKNDNNIINDIDDDDEWNDFFLIESQNILKNSSSSSSLLQINHQTCNDNNNKEESNKKMSSESVVDIIDDFFFVENNIREKDVNEDEFLVVDNKKTKHQSFNNETKNHPHSNFDDDDDDDDAKSNIPTYLIHDYSIIEHTNSSDLLRSFRSSIPKTETQNHIMMTSDVNDDVIETENSLLSEDDFTVVESGDGDENSNIAVDSEVRDGHDKDIVITKSSHSGDDGDDDDEWIMVDDSIISQNKNNNINVGGDNNNNNRDKNEKKKDDHHFKDRVFSFFNKKSTNQSPSSSSSPSSSLSSSSSTKQKNDDNQKITQQRNRNINNKKEVQTKKQFMTSIRIKPPPPPPPPSCYHLTCNNRFSLICSKCKKEYCDEHIWFVPKKHKFQEMSGKEEEFNKLVFINEIEDEFSIIDIENQNLHPICVECQNYFYQSIGPTRNHSNTFVKIRSAKLNYEQARYQFNREMIKQNLPLIISDQNKKSTVSSSIFNPLRSIIWSVKDTWSQCSQCSENFDRLTMKYKCDLCELTICSNCKLKLIQFQPRYILLNCKYNQSLELKVCGKCFETLRSIYRRVRFYYRVNDKRNLLLQQKHAELINFATSIDDLLPRFLKINDVNDESFVDVYESLNNAMNSYLRLSNLLQLMIARPINKNAEITKAQSTVYQYARRSHNSFYHRRYVCFRSHENYLKSRSKK